MKPFKLILTFFLIIVWASTPIMTSAEGNIGDDIHTVEAKGVLHLRVTNEYAKFKLLGSDAYKVCGSAHLSFPLTSSDAKFWINELLNAISTKRAVIIKCNSKKEIYSIGMK